MHNYDLEEGTALAPTFDANGLITTVVTDVAGLQATIGRRLAELAA